MTEEETLKFWERARKAILEKYGTWSRFYKESGLSQATIERARQRNSAPQPSTLIAMADCLDMSIDYLLTGIDPSYTDSQIIVKKNENMNRLVKYLNDEPDKLHSILELFGNEINKDKQ